MSLLEDFSHTSGAVHLPYLTALPPRKRRAFCDEALNVCPLCLMHLIKQSACSIARMITPPRIRTKPLPQRVYAAHTKKAWALLHYSKEAAKDAILYSYKHGFNGFAACLLPEHVAAISEIPDVISVFPNRRNKLHTTRSWEFLGLKGRKGHAAPGSLWEKANFGKDVIIGSLDSGVWPESESFNDNKFGPIPKKWKGTCVNGMSFNSSNCNRKLIGAQYFIKGYEAENKHFNITASGDYLSPRDKGGHGTHTSSTAGGNFVRGANLLGFAKGTAKGGAPLSRIAVYKVCWPTDAKGGECYDADILSAFDRGIHDGVDVFTISLGSSPPLPPFFEDGIAIGAFHAAQKGIVVVCSAGNDGPNPASVANIAPWIITVAASTIDRAFPSKVILGNNAVYTGQSLAQRYLIKKMYPIVSSSAVADARANKSASQLCFPGSLDPSKVKGKIVACLRGITARVSKGEVVHLAGGAGMVLCNSQSDANEVIADAHLLPATQITAQQGKAVYAYLNLTKSPMAYITAARTALNVKPAPTMASFSSQGPNSLTPDILKPDITAPGLNILAAFSEATSPTGLSMDHRIGKFNIDSGTSMACPHVAGVAALLKALYPDWSPAAIRSAIMTTATLIDNTRKPIRNASFENAGPFNFGSGQVNPNAAADPGLIYDTSPHDYTKFLCTLKLNQSSLRIISGKEVKCHKSSLKQSNLNYPSIAISSFRKKQTIKRTVTNVGKGKSVYTAVIDAPKGISISVHPPRLRFSHYGEKRSFKIKLKLKHCLPNKYVFGSLGWTDGTHVVRSPIALKSSKKC